MYVGKTGQDFDTRLKQHRKPRGVLAEISRIQWQADFCEKFVVYVKDLDITSAKFFESVFLAAFNFARNKEENNEKRGLYCNASLIAPKSKSTSKKS